MTIQCSLTGSKSLCSLYGLCV